MSRPMLVMSVLVVVACSGSKHGVGGSGSASGGAAVVNATSGSDHGNTSAATAVPATQAPAAAARPPLAAADTLPLDGNWLITMRSVEQGNPSGSQYGHYVRISPTGEIFEWVRHELNGGTRAVWKEAATARGSIRQLDAHTLRIRWSPEEPHEYHLRSRDKKSFVLGRSWALKEDLNERATRPYPRAPRGDRRFDDTWTFEQKSAPRER